MKKNLIFLALLYWLPLALAITLLSGLVYAAVQQDMRQGANDPQIQMAEDAARVLSRGESPASLPFGAPVDIASSPAPFMIVFDDAGRPLASSALLHGAVPSLPPGVLAFAKAYGEDRVTWQPEPDVRQAMVVAPYTSIASSGFVAAGRSLREVERRERRLTEQVFLAWMITLGSTLIAVVVLTWLKRHL